MEEARRNGSEEQDDVKSIQKYQVYDSGVLACIWVFDVSRAF